ncbi:hypothetical protein GCM10029964_091950 [Kibdelosporangium lantanae]
MRYAESMPTVEDNTWAGDTGRHELERGVYPPRRVEVAFVLFGNGGVPVHVGQTGQFRLHLKTLHQGGVAWESWLGCAARVSAIVTTRAHAV